MKYLFASILITVAFLGVKAQQLSDLSDEFNRTCSLSEWQDIEEVEGWTNTHLESFDVNTTNEGQLTMIPWTTAWH